MSGGRKERGKDRGGGEEGGNEGGSKGRGGRRTSTTSKTPGFAFFSSSTCFSNGVYLTVLPDESLTCIPFCHIEVEEEDEEEVPFAAKRANLPPPPPLPLPPSLPSSPIEL